MSFQADSIMNLKALWLDTLWKKPTGRRCYSFPIQQIYSVIEKMYVSGVFGGLPEYKEVSDEAE